MKLIKYIATLVLFLLSATMAKGATITFDDIDSGLRYEVIDASTVKVVSSSYSGTSYTIPATVNYNSTTYTVVGIGEEAFKDCINLTSITIEGGQLDSIGNQAFYNCKNLANFTIPASVTKMGENVFEYCQKFTTINIPEGVEIIGNRMFANCTKLASVTIPARVKIIGESAFNSCTDLTSITLPEGLDSIGTLAFYNCEKLANFTIPASVTKMGENVFEYCREFTTINIPEGVEIIGNRMFANCTKLASVTIPARVKIIGESAFNSCTDLTSVTLPEGLDSIGASAFFGCGFTSFTIPASVTKMGETVFNSCANLTSITIPEGIEHIRYSTFTYCFKLSTVTLPSTLKIIDQSAFSNCTTLVSITIPARVDSIGYTAFGNCSSLTSITMESTTPPRINSTSFRNSPPTQIITVPYGSKSTYDVAKHWADIKDRIKEAAPTTPPTTPTTPPATPFDWFHVSLPAVEGVTFIRYDEEFKSVERDVMEGESFGFYIKLAKGLDPESVEVTTTRDGVIEPRESDGMYIIRDIQEDLTIHVKVSSTPLSNEPEVERATRVWSEASAIVINADSPAKASIVNLAGAIKAIREIPAGETRFNLPPDIYLVTVGTETVKVIVK